MPSRFFTRAACLPSLFIFLVLMMGPGTTQVKAGNVGKSWRVTSPLPTGADLTGLVWTGTKLVAAGRNVALTSADGVTWTAVNLGGDSATCLAWSDTLSLLVAGATDRGSVLTSTDGAIWNKTDTNYNGTFLHLTWSGTQFVGVGKIPQNDGTTIWHLLTSADGLNWSVSTIPLPIGQKFLTVDEAVWTGSLYVVAGYAQDSSLNLSAFLASSPDGINWTPATLDGSAPDAFHGLVWTGTQVVAVGNAAAVYTSPTGDDPWTAQVSGGGTTPLTNVIWDGSQLVAAGATGVVTSSDGITWNATTQSGLPTSSLASTGTKYVLAGAGGSIFTSSDASAWTRQTPSGSTNTRLAVIRAGATFGNRWVSVGGDTTGVIETSTDGSTWMADTLPADTKPLYGITAGSSDLIAVGDSGSIVYSTDGTNWTKSPLVTTDYFNGVACSTGASPEVMVAVGNASDFSTGKIYTSTDAAQWTSVTLPDGVGIMYAVTYHGGQFIAVGDSGVILTSPNGTTWTQRTSGTFSPLFAVTASSSLLVAVGGGVILSSPDGITWADRTPGLLSVACNGIVWDGTDFVVVASSNAITSPDGLIWTPRTTGIATTLWGIAANGSGPSAQALAVGDTGVVIISDAIPTATTKEPAITALESDATVRVTVKLDFDAGGGTVVPFTLSGTAVAGTDYTATASPLTFAAGETSKNITLTLINDGQMAADKTVIVTLGTPTGARLGCDISTAVTIVNTNYPPPVSFTTDNLTASEGDGTVGVAVQLGWASTSTVTVPLNVTGTATSGADYSTLPASLIFNPGEQFKSLPISIINDPDVENDETVIVALGSPINGTLGAVSQFTLTIQDNDVAGGVGGQWTASNPLPANGLQCVAWAPDLPVPLLLAMGDQGIALTSSDGGHNWIRRITGTTRPHSSVTWGGPVGNKRFVAVGGDNTLLSSPDGIAWTESLFPGTSSALDATIFKVIWVNNAFVALGTSLDFTIGDNVPVVYVSPDGVRWSKKDLGTVPGGVRSIAWTGSQFVIVGGGITYNPITTKYISNPVVLTSPDGDTWTNQSTSGPAGVAFDDVIWTGSQLVAMCLDKVAYTSPDAIHWTKRTIGSLGTVDREIWTGTKLVAVGQVTATSSNGTTWVEKASGIAPLTLVDVAYTGTQFVAVGGTSTIIFSSDGAVWTKFPGSVDTNLASVKSIAWSGTQFVAVGDAGLIMTSPTGTGWNKRTSPLARDLYRVAWSGTQFVAVGRAGALLTSTNGIAWTTRASGTNLDLFGATWSGSQFVVVGGQNNYDDPVNGYTLGTSIVLTSPNGTAWTKRKTPATAMLTGIAFNGSGYVACGGWGNILTSPDAITWTSQTSGTIYNLSDAIWADTQFVVIGDNNVIVHSPDGIYWQAASSIPSLYSGAPFSGIAWTGSTYIVVGGGGYLLTSPDADVWTGQNSGTGSNLHGLAWNGAQMVTVGDTGTVLTSGTGTPPALPVLTFTSPSIAVSEGGGPFLIGLELSSPPTQKVTVPFTFTGPLPTNIRLGAAGDVILPTVPLVFNPGITHLYLVVKIVNDNTPESPRTATMALTSASGATLGTPSTFDIALQDNDIAIQIGTQPLPLWMAVGDTATPAFLVAATGSSSPSYQWQRSGVNLPGSTFPQVQIYGARLSDGGLYKVIVKNNVGSLTSNSVELAVVDTAPHPVVVAQGATATFTAYAQGATVAGLHYQWYKGANQVSNTGTRIAGAMTKTLVIKLTAPADIDTYHCTVTSATQSGSLDTGDYTLSLTTAKPQFIPSGMGSVPDPLPDGFVAVTYPSQFITVQTNAAVKFTATGLPAGLKLDPVFGVIYGTPTATANNQKVVITATNASGPVSVTTHVTIAALPPGVAGTYDGYLGRDASLNSMQGARFQATITGSGSYTGKVFLGSISYAITGALSYASLQYGSTTTFARPGKTPLAVGFLCNPVSNTLDLVLTEIGGIPIPGQAWGSVWTAALPPAKRQGYSTFAIDIASAHTGDLLVPQGTGYGSCTVPASGANFPVSGKLADGSAFLTSTFLGPDGQVLLYQPLYAGKGGLLGYVSIRAGTTTPNIDSTVDAVDAHANATLSWYKPASTLATERTYKAGFDPPDMLVAGSRYVAPVSTARVMGLASGSPNASLTFTEQDFIDNSDAPDINVQVLPKGTLAPLTSNPKHVTLTFTPASGLFTGSFKLAEGNPLGGTLTITRLVPFNGIIRTTGGATTGVGWFMLPTLPAPPSSSGVGLPVNQTPIRSGRVEVKAY